MHAGLCVCVCACVRVCVRACVRVRAYMCGACVVCAECVCILCACLGFKSQFRDVAAA